MALQLKVLSLLYHSSGSFFFAAISELIDSEKSCNKFFSNLLKSISRNLHLIGSTTMRVTVAQGGDFVRDM